MTQSAKTWQGESGSAVGALVRLTLAELLRTKRAVLAAVLLLLPAAFTVYWSFAEWITGDPIYQWGIIFSLGYLNFAIPFLTLFWGAALVSGEQESQTLVYLLTRGVSRTTIALAKFLTTAVVCLAAVTASMLLSWLLLVLHFGAGVLLATFPWWLALAGAAAAASVVYLSVFFALGLVLRRPAAAGIVFILFWEGLVGLLHGPIRYATVLHYPRSIAANAADSFGVTIPAYITASHVSTPVALVVMAFIAAGALGFALWWFSKAEYPTTPDR